MPRFSLHGRPSLTGMSGVFGLPQDLDPFLAHFFCHRRNFFELNSGISDNSRGDIRIFLCKEDIRFMSEKCLRHP